MCCTRLVENTGRKKIAILAPSHKFVGLYLRTWGVHRQSQKRLLNNDNSSTYPHNMVNFGLLTSMGHPCKFQRLSRLGSVTARYFSSGRQPNFAALNRRRHLYSAGRPSRWALAHIQVKLCSSRSNKLSLYRPKYTVLHKKTWQWTVNNFVKA